MILGIFSRHPDESRDLFSPVVNQRDRVLQRGDGVFFIRHPAEARNLFFATALAPSYQEEGGNHIIALFVTKKTNITIAAKAPPMSYIRIGIKMNNASVSLFVD